jgi:acetyltransferase-like isoleucine patch superfamily enzyme
MKAVRTEKPNRYLMGQIPLEKEFKGAGALRSVAGRLLHCVARYLPMYPGWRASLHRLRGVKIGKGVFIGMEVFIDNTYPDSIVIEDSVTIINRCFIIGHNFIPVHLENILGKNLPPKRGVVLKRGSYLGAQSLIMPGVTIGECSVVGAGSIVTENVPDYCVAMGAPAKVVRRFTGDDVILDQFE